MNFQIKQKELPKKIITIKENTSILIVVIACIYELEEEEIVVVEEIMEKKTFKANPTHRDTSSSFNSNITFST